MLMLKVSNLRTIAHVHFEMPLASSRGDGELEFGPRVRNLRGLRNMARRLRTHCVPFQVWKPSFDLSRNNSRSSVSNSEMEFQTCRASFGSKFRSRPVPGSHSISILIIIIDIHRSIYIYIYILYCVYIYIYMIYIYISLSLYLSIYIYIYSRSS